MKKSMGCTQVMTGIYHFLANLQWNHIVSSFQQDIPIKSHVRYHFKTYHDCFTATHAVTWLKNFFAENGMYGDVTTAQVR